MDYKITHIKGGTDNCYIVSCGKDAILVDTSSGPSRQMVLDECSKYNMKLAVLTHPHFDHSGRCFGQLDQAWNGTSLF